MNGLPYTFAFSGLTEPIAKIRISLDPLVTQGGGFAFDNFNATGLPPTVPSLSPGGLLTLGLLISALAAIQMRRNQA